ncbi:MAG: Fic family protein [Kiritimatiellae bacterium]|jgi:Fic family protein|nr:Fic family protein [Kiritimatiellia bacterium]
MKDYQPPYTLNSAILKRVADICELLGRFSESRRVQEIRLRRINRIRTIQGSLAIEGNTLTEDQISTILDGKPVIAPMREVQEVRNALSVYDQCAEWSPLKEKDLFKAHKLLMFGLVDSPGTYRKRGAGVMGVKEMVHIAPPAANVPHLMKELFGWLKSTEEHPLIVAAVFHYEFEFIHPFEDGNGRMGRLWQMMILRDWNPLFANIPVESIVYANQQGYYKAINVSGGDDGCTPFIEFMLDVITETLVKTQVKTRVKKTPEMILQALKKNSELTLAEVAVAIGKSTSAVERAARKLVKSGRLKYVGPQKGGHWEVIESK